MPFGHSFYLSIFDLLPKCAFDFGMIFIKLYVFVGISAKFRVRC